MDRRALFFPCGLVLASAYLTTPAPVDYSFALDKPLHTTALVLLLTGLALVVVEAWSSRRRPHHHQHQPLSATTYVAFALNNVQTRHPGEEIWTEAGLHAPRRPWGLRAVGALLAVLLLAICGRIAIFYRVTTHVECTGPSPLAFLPLVVALYHSLRHPSLRQYPAWSADTRMRSPLDRVFGFVFNGSTRYIIPSLLFAISTFLVSIKSTTLRSSYICPIANADATAVPSLQFVGFLLDCLILQVLYRLVDDGVSEPDDWSILLQDGTSNHVLVGMTFIASSLVLVVAGIVIYPTMPEHREWMLSFSSDYLLGLLRLSLMIPFTTLCFVKSARLYGVMSSVLTVAFSSAYIGVLRALGTGVSHAFPPKSTVGLVLCFTLLTIALILHLLTDTNIETRIRSKVAFRLGRNQSATFIVLLIAFSIGVVVYRRQGPLLEHPITTLIDIASVQHDKWASQAHRSNSLAEAVVHYRQRYNRDPPPNFDKWYSFAVNRNSIVIDDYDNIEQDLAPFSSFNPDDLRLRTATVLATRQAVGGIRIRDGNVEVFENVEEAYRETMDSVAAMIQKFAEFLPDMDLAINLQDESRVAVPYERLQDALDNPQPYPVSDATRSAKGFSADRADKWLHINRVRTDPHFFENAQTKPVFETYGSIACSPDSRARKERHWNTKTFCHTCTQDHSVGAFVSNWTLSADPCHQPDLANLHGMHLSPSNLMGTHDIVPIFSQSRAPGFVDIRYPSPRYYADENKYGFDEKSPDPHFADKLDVLFWRGTTTEGATTYGTWKGMLRQRLVHLLNNETSRQPILLPKTDHSGHFEYMLKRTNDIKRLLETKTDVRLVGPIARCAGLDCIDQTREFGFADPIDLQQHWRYRYLFDTDGAAFSTRFIPFLQSNSVVFKAALFREWYEGRLTAWKHFVPVDIRLHDLFSSLAYFGGYGVEERNKRMMEGHIKAAEKIARDGKVWTEKVLRKEDMEIYMFRLLLEWGRLTDDARTEVGFRMDKGRRSEEREVQEL
ncbi:glycosyltransferase family 90 protein [Bipolaris maydis ATCC 48331]|uniref:Glycosyltransferase family 90 protein n=2 Tax=Cochliobolus heterostrophus TaxID=5016 RepID=M2T967_COCH5|nr:glycosyltransferase family 90 protein [Bipolaris maydis ATCC 48331]EMD94100.1 glycosyltransferase family 90 protein [Bipolaris maydis C5]ENI07598.1 glycosyltransferase family 90 protein [Bipolaris maydis ATCC 48331]KAJ6209551.1 glycosyltransferase family 90 protein [Bipolaris maydis]